MRCLTLAEGLRSKGANCKFICRQFHGDLGQRVAQAGFEVCYLPSSFDGSNDHILKTVNTDFNDWLGTDWNTDLDQTKIVIGCDAVDLLIVDHYGIDYRWESAMRSECKKLMVIDDLADRRHDCDLLLDQNVIEKYKSRYDELVSRDCVLLLGPDYALLQPQYAELRLRSPPKLGPVRRVLIYFGGADAANLTERSLDAFLDLAEESIHLDVVLSPTSKANKSILAKVKHLSHVTVYEGLPSLAPLMVSADFSIGASGTTSWERCCLGLPTIVITIAMNQEPIAKELHRRQAIRWIGCSDTVETADLAKSIGEFLSNSGEIEQRSTICKAIVDGNGLERTLEILMMNPDTKLFPRLVTVDDEALTLEWANDPLVRRNGFNPGKIDPETHRAWFHSRLGNRNSCFFFIICTDSRFPIGQVRFERNSENWEIHYSLAPYARNRGLGRRVVEVALYDFLEFNPSVTIYGRVKPENFASRKVLESLGFERVNTEEIHLLYRYTTGLKTDQV
jgi:UDP-2,4-diacetamido-2,4,6-trideoxy-beta-L-altropyranose hydrolase